MKRDDFDALVHRLEGLSQRRPRAYASRVVALVVLAYVYLGIVLIGAISLTLLSLLAAIKLPKAAVIKFAILGIIAFGGLSWVILKGLWVRLSPPAGQRLTREQAPVLFNMLEELRSELRCPPFHEVLVVNEYNAAVVQNPRLGVFGWYRNYLLLGLPLMQSLAPDEFKAVLAHEFAHSSGGHGRIGNWLYRVRRSWDRIFEEMARQKSAGAGVLTKFVSWYWPVFNAHAFVLARANEYEADACAARLVGPEATANALMRLPVGSAILDESFWPGVFSLANQRQEPPKDVSEEAGRALRMGPTPDLVAKSLRHAFLLETNNSDTHPCLKDRLRSIGRLPEGNAIPLHIAPPGVSAAEIFLGAHEAVVSRMLSEEWHDAIAASWAERHKKTQTLATELASLDAADMATADAATLWAKIKTLLQLQGDKAALPYVKQLLALDPNHAAANFVHGRHDLEDDHPQGIVYVETALRLDPTLTVEGCNLLYGYYSRTGQRGRLREIEDRMDAFREMTALAQKERADISIKDIFLPAGLAETQLNTLRAVLAGEPDVGAAAIVRKDVKHLPSSACYIIGIKIQTSWWKLRSNAASQHLVNRLVEKIELPGQFLMFVVEENLKKVGKKVFAVPGAAFYQRKQA